MLKREQRHPEGKDCSCFTKEMVVIETIGQYCHSQTSTAEHGSQVASFPKSMVLEIRPSANCTLGKHSALKVKQLVLGRGQGDKRKNKKDA